MAARAFRAATRRSRPRKSQRSITCWSSPGRLAGTRLEFGKLLSVSLGANRDAALGLAKSHLGPYYSGRFNIERDAAFGTAAQVAAGVEAFTAVDAARLTMILEPPTLGLDHLRALAGRSCPYSAGEGSLLSC